VPPPPKSGPSLRAVTAALSASAALLLGALYGLGAIVEARRLAVAHTSIADVLPQVPLPHLLAEGIGLLIGTLIVLAAITLVVLALLRLETQLEPWLASQRVRSREIRSKLAVTSGQLHEMKDEAASLARVVEEVRRVEADPPDTSPPTTEAELAERIRVKSELEALLVEAKDHESRRSELLSRIETLKSEHDRYARKVKLGNVPFRVFARGLRWGPLTVGIVVGIFVRPALAASLVIAGLVWTLHRRTDVRKLLLALYFIVVAGFLIGHIVDVPPLPNARVNTDSGTYSGTLLLATETRWYLAGPHGGVTAIDSTRVLSASYSSPQTQGPESLFDLVEDAVE
jgi:hypothetical protein